MPKRRLVLLPRYPDSAASARLRLSQFVPDFLAAGLPCASFPFYGNDYHASRFGSSVERSGAVVRAMVNRVRVALAARPDDLAFAQFEFLPFAPSWLERRLVRRFGRLVLDFDDAWFHLYDSHPRWFVRRLYAEKLPRLLREAHAVVVGSGYLREFAVQHSARVVFVPTCVDLERYPWPPAPPPRSPFRICWIGSKTTSPYLRTVAEPLARFCRETGAVVRLVGADARSGIAGPHVEYLPWSECTEVRAISECHVGIMPLHDDMWTRGKCGYKLIQYMACGLPTVASPVGENVKVLEGGACGLLASDPGQWLEALLALSRDPALRHDLGVRGRRRVEQHYSVQRWGRELAGLLAGL